LAPGTDPEEIAPDPILNPYRHINFSEGVKIIPGSAAPYRPSSGDLMLQIPNDAADGQLAKMSVGGLQANPCFRFDFTSMQAGCASKKANCVFNITGLSWDDDAQAEVIIGSQMSSTRACSRQKNCKLGAIVADATAGLSNLTSLVIDVTSHNLPQKWWADDIAISWTDASCDAAVCRSNVRDIYPKRGLGQGMTQIVKVVHP
jgi:hypothetical protein